MRADLGRRILEPADRPGVRALRDVHDDLADRGGAARGEVARGGRDPAGRGVVLADGGGADLRRLGDLGGHVAGGDLDLLAVDRGVQAVGEEAVDGVGVEPGGGGLGAAVLRDRAVPGVDVVPLGRAQPKGVGAGPQHGGAAEEVGAGVAAQLGGRAAGEPGGLLQGALVRVADQVHDAEAVGLAGLPVVPVEAALAVADGGQQVARHVVALGGVVEGVVERPAVPGGEGGRGDAGQRSRGQHGEGGERRQAAAPAGNAATVVLTCAHVGGSLSSSGRLWSGRCTGRGGGGTGGHTGPRGGRGMGVRQLGSSVQGRRRPDGWGRPAARGGASVVA